jgi:EpsI family protein
MIDRRDFIFLGGCAAALGTAHWLRPRDQIDLVGTRSVEDMLPRSFGAWRSSIGGDILIPKTEGSLADRLYSTIVSRNYARSPDEPPVMLLVAHGGLQSDLLQLHRPEACYPAVGFSIVDRQEASLPLSGAGGGLPVVNLSAQAGDTFEDIVYWTRLGEYLPRSASEQRRDRLAAAMQGYVGDGVLVRASVRRGEGDRQYALVSTFLRDLVQSISPDARAAFVGTSLATEVARA